MFFLKQDFLVKSKKFKISSILKHKLIISSIDNKLHNENSTKYKLHYIRLLDKNWIEGICPSSNFFHFLLSQPNLLKFFNEYFFG